MKNFEELGFLLIDRGEAMATLGNALKNGNTTMARLVQLADIAGLAIDFRLIQREVDTTKDTVQDCPACGEKE